MRVRALDSNGDWTFGKGRNDYLVGKAARVQNIQTRLKSFLGDCFFDLAAGVDWFTYLGGKNLPALNFAAKACILNTEGVTGLIENSVTLDAARLTIPNYTVSVLDEEEAAAVSAATISPSLLLDELGNIITTEDGTGLGI